MKDSVNLAAMKINGHDPRQSKAFLMLSSDFGALRSGEKTNLKWSKLEEQCYQIFRQYGYDFMTGSWFSLISTQQYGWKGLAQALDLMSEAFSLHSEHCWPPASQPEQRRAILQWFCHHVSTLIYTLPQQPEHIVLMQRVETSIDTLCAMARDCQSRNLDALNNLRYFLQVRSRSVGHFKTPAKAVFGSSVVVPANPTENTLSDLIDGAEPKSKVKHFSWVSVLSGVLTGVVLTLSSAGLYYWLKPYTLDEQLAAPLQVLHQADSIPVANLAQWSDARKAVMTQMDKQLSWLAAQPPQFMLTKGQNAALQLERLYPGNIVSLNWNNTLQEKSASLGSLDGWQAANRHLDQLEQRLLASEKIHNQYLTISELKTAVYQLQQDLQHEGAPAEALLLQMQHKIANGQPIGNVLAQQTQDRITDILARYQVIMNSMVSSVR